MNQKRKSKIIFEQRILAKGRGPGRYVVDVLLKINGEYVDIDSLSRGDPIIHRIKERYWRIIKRLHVPGCTILVRLSGLHYDPFAAKEYLISGENRTNMIVEYRSWRLQDFTDGISYCVMECDSFVFKQLYERYWFSIGKELRFEAFAVKKEKIKSLDKWYKRAWAKSKDAQLYEMSELAIDNQHNGIHFKLLFKRRGGPLWVLLRDLN